MATPIKFGTEFLLNTTTDLHQTHPTLTALADGRFVGVWMDLSQSGDDTDSWAVRAQIFNADGSKSGGEFVVNTTIASAQTYPVVAGLSDGRFVVAWQDFSATGGDTSSWAIRAQVFNADGTLSGAEFLVNTTTSGFQDAPEITAFAGGGYVISWQDYSAGVGDTDNAAIRAQVYAADGSTVGGEILVNTTTAGPQLEPSITALDTGRFVVVWTDWSGTGADTSSSAVRAQIFNADGTAFRNEFLVNNTTANGQSQPTVAALSGGRFVVIWTDSSGALGDASQSGIAGQVFAADGTRIGSEFLVNTNTSGEQDQPTVAALADGRFVVIWTEYSFTAIHADNDREAVVGQVMNADGTKSGDEFLVNTTIANVQQNPKVIALADGRFVVTWEDGSTANDPSSWGSAAQIFDPREAAVNLTGTGLDDDLIGTVFNDTISGGNGADRLAGGSGGDSIVGGNGHDRLFGNGGHDWMNGNNGRDKIYGGFGKEKMFGGTGADKMFGGDGNDRLSGQGHKDKLVGGLGRDTLIGGTGADRFVFETVDDSGTTGATRDVIADFNQAEGDRIFLSAIDAGSAPGDQAFVFIGTAAFSGAEGELRYHQTATRTFVEADIDGDGQSDFEIMLKGLHALTDGDFVL